MPQATPSPQSKPDPKPDKKATITVTYNGEVEEFDFQPNQQIHVLLQRAIQRFGIAANQHLMALFTAAGTELTNEHQKFEDAGIKAGDQLLLRQSTVKGG